MKVSSKGKDGLGEENEGKEEEGENGMPVRINVGKEVDGVKKGVRKGGRYQC